MDNKQLQKMLDDSVKAKRSDDMKTSEQLMLCEIISKLENITNKELPIVFDDSDFVPTAIGSWRGSYRELAICYEGGNSFNTDEIEYEDFEYGHSYKQQSTELPKKPKAQDLLDMLKLCLGKSFTGYKGGNFEMGKSTPLWVANYGTSNGYKSNDDCWTQAVVDIQENNKNVVIVTKLIEY